MALDPDRLIKPVKKLRQLVKTIDDQATPTEVHQLRTNARRFEATFEALSLNGHGKSMLKSVGRIRKRAGKVRDMDVLTANASTVHVDGEEDCSVQLLEYLGVKRQKHAKKLHAEIRAAGSDLRADLKRAPDLLAKHEAVNTDATANAIKLAANLAFPKHLGSRNLHAYRLKVKELRDVLRMTSGAPPKFVEDLGQVKDAIGDWHDWEELVLLAEKALTHGNQCKFLKELKRVAEQKYQDALALTGALRKTYLRNFHTPKKSAAAASASSSKQPVWEAIAKLAS
jgi:CHAD domain-containing protein